MWKKHESIFIHKSYKYLAEENKNRKFSFTKFVHVTNVLTLIQWKNLLKASLYLKSPKEKKQ